MPSDATPDLHQMVAGFVSALSDRLTDAESGHWQWQSAQESVRSDASQLVEQNAQLAEDDVGLPWIEISAFTLALYRSLRSSLGNEKRSLELLREALTGLYRPQVTSYLQLRFGISQDSRKEAFRRVSENFHSRAEERFGRSFGYVDDVRDDGRVFVNVEKCLFNEFFRRNGAPEVMGVMCAFDTVWADEVNNEPEYGMRFEMPTTLGRGDDVCRFQFTKTWRD